MISETPLILLFLVGISLLARGYLIKEYLRLSSRVLTDLNFEILDGLSYRMRNPSPELLLIESALADERSLLIYNFKTIFWDFTKWKIEDFLPSYPLAYSNLLYLRSLSKTR